MPIQSRRECAVADGRRPFDCDPAISWQGRFAGLPGREARPGMAVRHSWPGRSPNLSPRLNRRELLVAGGAVGAAVAAVSAGGHCGRGGRRAGPVRQASRRSGQDDRRPGGGRGAGVSGRALRLRDSGGPEQRVVGRVQGPRRSLPAGRPRGFGQRDGRRVGPRDGRGRGLLRGPRSGPDQRPDRDRRGPVR